MRLRRVIEIDSLDVAHLQATLASSLEQARALRVEDGLVVHPVTGRPMPRLRVASGSHPRPGTVYEARVRRAGPPIGNAPIQVGAKTITPDDPRATRFREGLANGPHESTAQVRLVADDRRRAEAVSTRDDGSKTTVRIAEPSHPSGVVWEYSMPGGSSWWTRGELTSAAVIDLSGLGQASRRADRPIGGRIRHRRFVADGGVAVEPVDGKVHLILDVKARGRGVLRPPLALVGVLFGWLIRRQWNELFDDWDADGRPLVAQLTSPGEPAEMAGSWLVDLLAPYVDDPSSAG